MDRCFRSLSVNKSANLRPKARLHFRTHLGFGVGGGDFLGSVPVFEDSFNPVGRAECSRSGGYAYI